MRVLRAIGKFIWRFMVIFSFIVNIILVIALVGLLLLIFDIKSNIANPLIKGLHSSFVGLETSTIDWTIPVRTSIPLDTSIPLNTSIPLETDTTVVLTNSVPLTLSANIVAPSLTVENATVYLSLPAGTELPVHLKLDVPVNLQVPVNLDVPVELDVRAVIPLGETQLRDPVDNLRLLFEPIVRVLDNLPDDFSEVGPFASQLLSGTPPDLTAETPYSQDPWPGFSQTAGLNYTLGDEPVPPENVPMLTNIVTVGGIPALDEAIRPELYTGDDTPETINAQSQIHAQALGVLPEYYNGSYSALIVSPVDLAAQGVGGVVETPMLPDGGGDAQLTPVAPIGSDGSASGSSDLGILPTPTATGW